MPGRARIARNVAAALVVAGLVAGTLIWQTDDTWPLAQMRMFPGGGESAIAITIIRAQLADGRTKEMNPFAFHLKRAEIEGQMNRIRANPRMLQALIDRYNEDVRWRSRIVALVLTRRETLRADGSAIRTEKEIVRWPR